MKIQIGDIVRFKLNIDSVSSMQEKKLINTASRMVPTNLGPYHGVYKDEPEVPDSLDLLSQRTIVGAKLLGMTNKEIKRFCHNNKSFEIQVENIERENNIASKISIDCVHQKWLTNNCMKCRKNNNCQHYYSATNKRIMHKKIMENNLDEFCKFMEL